MNRMIAAVVLALTVVFVHIVGAADAKELLVFHDLAAMTPIARGTTASLTPVITDAGSMFTGTLLPGFRQAPHHHDNEQFTMAVDGDFVLTVGDQSHQMKPFTIAMVPSNVAHAMARTTDASPVVLEYQPIARRDWASTLVPPPYKTDPPAMTPPGVSVVADLSRGSDGWHQHRTGVRSKGFGGQTIAIRMWDIAKGSSTDIVGDARVQRFAYVFDGNATIESGTTSRAIARQMCVEIAPTARHVTVRAANSRAMIGVFETIGR